MLASGFVAALGGPGAGTAAVAAMVVGWRCSDPVRGWNRSRIAAARRRDRRDERETRLENAGVYGGELAELTDIVEAVTRVAPRAAEYFGLDDLLDLYADVAIGEEALRNPLRRESPTEPDSTAPHVRAVRMRALAWRQAAADRAVACEDSLVEISQLIRLYAERATTPEIDHVLDDELIGRQLRALDCKMP